MVTHSTTYGTQAFSRSEDCDKQLQLLVDEINNYLYHVGHHWIFLTLGRSHFQKCCRSWVRVYTHLDKFLQDPRTNYSLLMIIIEHEKRKFPHGSFYAKKLAELDQLLSLGPAFSITIIH